MDLHNSEAAKFQQHSKIRGRVSDDLTNFPGPFFSGGVLSQGGGARNCAKFCQIHHRRSRVCFRFLICYSVSQLDEHLKGQTLHFFASVKVCGGTGKISESVFSLIICAPSVSTFYWIADTLLHFETRGLQSRLGSKIIGGDGEIPESWFYLFVLGPKTSDIHLTERCSAVWETRDPVSKKDSGET